MKLKSQLIRLLSAEKESRAHAHTHTIVNTWDFPRLLCR